MMNQNYRIQLLEEQNKKLFEFANCSMEWFEYYASLDWNIGEEMKRIKEIKPMLKDFHTYLIKMQEFIDNTNKICSNIQLPMIFSKENSSNNNQLIIKDKQNNKKKNYSKPQSTIINQETSNSFQNIQPVNTETLKALKNQIDDNVGYFSFKSGINNDVFNVPRTSTSLNVSELSNELSLVIDCNEFEETKENLKRSAADLENKPAQTIKKTRWDVNGINKNNKFRKYSDNSEYNYKKNSATGVANIQNKFGYNYKGKNKKFFYKNNQTIINEK